MIEKRAERAKRFRKKTGEPSADGKKCTINLRKKEIWIVKYVRNGEKFRKKFIAIAHFS
jgi:hypothetical protein